MKPHLNKSHTLIKVRDKSVTLLELIIVIVLLGMIVLGFSTIELFSRFHVLASDRRAKLQNEVSHALEHMAKNIGQAIGNTLVTIPWAPQAMTGPVKITTSGNNIDILVWIDANPDGRSDPNDHEIIYAYRGAPAYTLSYTDVFDTQETIAQRIRTFNATLTGDYVGINMTACWYPLRTDCGSQDNPAVTMRENIKMPMVSAH